MIVILFSLRGNKELTIFHVVLDMSEEEFGDEIDRLYRLVFKRDYEPSNLFMTIGDSLLKCYRKLEYEQTALLAYDGVKEMLNARISCQLRYWHESGVLLPGFSALEGVVNQAFMFALHKTVELLDNRVSVPWVPLFVELFIQDFRLLVGNPVLKNIDFVTHWPMFLRASRYQPPVDDVFYTTLVTTDPDNPEADQERQVPFVFPISQRIYPVFTADELSEFIGTSDRGTLVNEIVDWLIYAMIYGDLIWPDIYFWRIMRAFFVRIWKLDLLSYDENLPEQKVVESGLKVLGKYDPHFKKAQDDISRIFPLEALDWSIAKLKKEDFDRVDPLGETGRNIDELFSKPFRKQPSTARLSDSYTRVNPSYYLRQGIKKDLFKTVNPSRQQRETKGKGERSEDKTERTVQSPSYDALQEEYGGDLGAESLFEGDNPLLVHSDQECYYRGAKYYSIKRMVDAVVQKINELQLSPGKNISEDKVRRTFRKLEEEGSHYILRRTPEGWGGAYGYLANEEIITELAWSCIGQEDLAALVGRKPRTIRQLVKENGWGDLLKSESRQNVLVWYTFLNFLDSKLELSDDQRVIALLDKVMGFASLLARNSKNRPKIQNLLSHPNQQVQKKTKELLKLMEEAADGN